MAAEPGILRGMERLSAPPATKPAGRARVYIVDGHPLIRRALAELIGEVSDLTVCGEAEDGCEALNAIVRLRPDIVIAEIALGANSGIELIKSIRSFDPRIGILVVSMQDEGVYALPAMRAGARGFVSKHLENDRILDAIRRVGSGQLCFSENIEAGILNRIVRGEHQAGESPVATLSDRELEVGRLIGGGASTQEIAARLRVSVKTVETHRSHLKGKLGLTNGVRLAQFWVNWTSRENQPGGPAAAVRGQPPRS